jgi:hypothetical protein
MQAANKSPGNLWMVWQKTPNAKRPNAKEISTDKSQICRIPSLGFGYSLAFGRLAFGICVRAETDAAA